MEGIEVQRAESVLPEILVLSQALLLPGPCDVGLQAVLAFMGDTVCVCVYVVFACLMCVVCVDLCAHMSVYVHTCRKAGFKSRPFLLLAEFFAHSRCSVSLFN